MSFVAVDLGASGTRYTSNCGTIRTIPNNMEIIHDVDRSIDMLPFDNSIEMGLEAVITKSNTKDENYPVKLLVGDMASRYTTPNSVPSLAIAKHKQAINYYSGIMAAAISKLYDESLGEDIDMYVAFPPTEVTLDVKGVINANFNGHYKVEFVKLGKTVEFNVVKTHVFEESYMAMISFYYGPDGRPRQENSNWLQGNILSIDIGDSTTDFTLVQNQRYMNRSGQTFRIGGRNVVGEVVRSISSTENYEMPDEIARQVVAEGRMQFGDGYKDASNIVASAKKKFAAMLRDNVEKYFSQINVPLQQIRAIVVSGGGSMPSQYVNADGEPQITSKSMAEYVTEELKSICPGVKVIPYGSNPRMANISGLYIRALVGESKKQMAAAKAASQSTQA